jgi:hypothetical protein
VHRIAKQKRRACIGTRAHDGKTTSGENGAPLSDARTAQAE